MQVKIHKISTEFTDAKGVTREKRGVVKPEVAARNGWKNITLVYRDDSGAITEKVAIG